MDKTLPVSDTATSFYLPYDRAFSVRVESNSNRLHMVNIWLLASGSYFRYEQKKKAYGEFGSDVFYTPREATVDPKGFSLNIRIESRDAVKNEEWRGSTIQIKPKHIADELEICVLSKDFGSSGSEWDHCKVIIKPIT